MSRSCCLVIVVVDVVFSVCHHRSAQCHPLPKTRGRGIRMLGKLNAEVADLEMFKVPDSPHNNQPSTMSRKVRRGYGEALGNYVMRKKKDIRVGPLCKLRVYQAFMSILPIRNSVTERALIPRICKSVEWHYTEIEEIFFPLLFFFFFFFPFFL